MKKYALVGLFLINCLLASCQGTRFAYPSTIEIVPESVVQQIPLIGDVAERRAEISGMAWCHDQLILLPQFPDLFGEEDMGSVFSIPREEIEDFLGSVSGAPIKPKRIDFDQAGLEELIAGFEGFEAIAFHQDQLFVTIEAKRLGGMMGFIAMGEIKGDCTEFVVNVASLTPIRPQAKLRNMSDESIIIYDDRVYTLYEANSVNINGDPIAHVFDLDLRSSSTVGLSNVEYRITDATEADEDGRFWAINYFYPGDTKLKPALDTLALKHGVGLTHQDADQVERLVAFTINEQGIVLADQQPLYLELSDGTARNWEGVDHFGNGFLLITDEHPSTILAYVEGLE